MSELNIEKFSPKKQELIEAVSKYKDLEIKGVEDKTGYLIVNEARKDLKRKRVEIEKTGKLLRSEAVQFQKAVISLEKDLISIIEPLEIELRGKQEIIDNEKLKLERQATLPERKARLLEINITIDDDFLLLLNDIKFEQFYNEKKTEYLLEKERVLKEKEEKLRREKEIEEAKKQARIEAEEEAEKQRKLAEEQAKKEAQEARIKAEQEKQKAIDLERQKTEKIRIKAEQEKQAILEEQRKQEEERKKREEEIRIKKENEEKERIQAQEKAEKNKKYKKWLLDNNFDEENMEIKRIGDIFEMWQKISTLNLA